MIGVFDSGIGGLSILKALREELPQENFIYIADSGHAPYGERDEAHVVARSQAVATYLAGQDIQALVVACNTATAAAIRLLRASYPLLPIIGVEPALKPAVAMSHTGHISVLATRSTLASAKFLALLDSQSGLATFAMQACDGLADAIEHDVNDQNATKLIALCARYTTARAQFGHQSGQIDTVVLGCTHYPFIKPLLHELLGRTVQIVDNGEAVARQTRRLLSGQLAVGNSTLVSGRVRLFATGQPQTLQAAAKRWLGVDTPVDLLLI